MITSERQGAIAILRFNRPDSLNALGSDGDGETVRRVCEAVNADLSVRCAILTGEGRAFCAGGDLKQMLDPQGPFSGSGIAIRSHYQRNIHRLARAIYGIEVPLIAAINGPAIGLGCDLACMADIRIASDRAKFAVPFLKLGLVAGDGGAWVLPRTIGMSRAAELFFTGDVIDATNACAWGLVSKVIAHDELIEHTLALAERIAKLPGHALRLTKSLLRQGRTSGHDEALEAAATMQVMSHATDDHQEGLAALIAKREPQFRG